MTPEARLKLVTDLKQMVAHEARRRVEAEGGTVEDYFEVVFATVRTEGGS